jgi:hypothetical protein
MAIKNYFFDGGNVTAAFVTQGDIVPDNTKRKITAAIVCNDTLVAKLFTARVVGSAGATAVTVISARTIDPGESYICPELVGRGMGPGGYVEVMADVTGMDFKFEAINITNG